MSKTLGNLSGFGKDLVYNMVYILGIGYMGGSITSICNSKKIDALFPDDIHNLPYNAPKSKGIINSIAGFPYSMKKKTGLIYNEYFNWFIDTWEYVFLFWREIYKSGANEGKSIYSGLFGNLFLFYIVPYILFYMTHIIPFISVPLAFIGSMHKEYSFIFTFAAILSWGYGYRKCESMDFSCFINMVCIGLTSIFLTFFYLPWWIFISISAWIYFVTFLIFSPFFNNAPGINEVFNEIIKHKASLTILFMLFTLRSSTTYLIPQVTSGLGICSLYILYTLYKQNKRK
jgi:hypothetical protein